MLLYSRENVRQISNAIQKGLYSNRDVLSQNSHKFPIILSRAKSIQERLNSVKKVAHFEIAGLFFSPCRWVKKRGRFKFINFFDWIDSFLNCLCSSRNICSFAVKSVMMVAIALPKAFAKFHYFLSISSSDLWRLF